MAEFQDLEIRLQAVDNASKTLEKVVSLLERVKELTGSGGSATTSNTTNGTKAQVQSTENLTDATKKAAEMAQILVDKEKLLLDATRGIKAAQEGSTIAQISLNKARNTASVNAQKYIDKEKALTSALERQAKAQENLKKAQAEQSRFESISGLLNQGKSVPTEDSTWLFQNQNTDFIGQVEKAQKELDAANKAVASSTLSAQSAYARYQNSLDSVQAAQIRVTNEQKRNEEQQKKLESQNNKTAFSFTTLASKISAITMTFRKVTNALFSAVEASGEFVENLNLFAVTFGDNYQETLDWALDFADNLGVASNEIVRFTGLFKQLSDSIGVATDMGTEMSRVLTQLGYDRQKLSLYTVMCIEKPCEHTNVWCEQYQIAC